MNSPVVVLDRVTKRFAGHTAVDGLSLAVPSGVIFGLLGPNGAGKTTSIRMIMDILEPDEGEVRLFGERGAGRDQSGRIGYLPEERGLYPRMRGFDGSAGAAEQVFAETGLVKKVDDYGQYAELELAPNADAQQILQRLVASGARLSRFELMEPSLNKIFIDLVGPEAARAAAQPG